MISAINKVSGMLHSNRMIGAAALFTALLLYVMLFQGSRGLWERDEGRYTNVALRMLKTGDYITPHLNDDTPHLTKPPLTYWAIAGGIKLLGWNEWGARLPNALAFFFTILLVYAIAKKIIPGRQFLAACIYATSLFPFIAGNVVTTDTLLTLWETLAVTGFVCWRHESDKGRGRHFLDIMWAGFGLAFLTKGPPGLLPLFVILIFMGTTGGWRSPAGLFSSSGLAFFLLIGFGWYVLVITLKPGMATYFLRDEVVGRVMSGMHHRNSGWYMGPVIYLPTIIFGTLPWTFPLLAKMRSAPMTLLSSVWWRIKFKADQWTVFLVLWIFIPLIIFFISRSRLPLYVLPLFVPIALATGRLMNFKANGNKRYLLLALWIIILIAIKFTGSLFPYKKDDRSLAGSIREVVTPSPGEVIFVDNDPFWGLSLYLDCQVKAIETSSYTEDQLKNKIIKEYSENANRLLFITNKNMAADFINKCRSFGFSTQSYGRHGSLAFIGLQRG